MKKSRTYSIYQRHFMLTAGLILIAFIMLGVAFLASTYTYAIREKKGTLETDAVQIAKVASLFLDQNPDFQTGDPQFRDLMAYIADNPDADVLLCGQDGTVQYCFKGDHSDEGSCEGRAIDPSVLSQIASGNHYQAMSDLGIYEGKKFAVGTPVMANQQPVGYVFITASVENLTGMWRSFGILFLLSAVAVLLIAFLSSYVTTRQQVRPLHELTDTIKRFGMGEYDLRAREFDSIEEISQLATAFNTMADSIACAEQRRQEFVANISHELKTPMTTISGFTDGILDGTIPPERQRESLMVISDETRRLSRLVRKMLDMSRLAAREHEVVVQSQFSITETFAQVLISLERKITSRNLDVDARFPDNDLLVWGDPDGITQVCYNLMDNAIKFARPGTAIGVSIVPKGTKAWISVRNTGETIPPEELGMIFDRFHKSDRSRSLDKEGVGLGLYIVKTILNNHKEDITVTSENGVTEFQFTLTLAE